MRRLNSLFGTKPTNHRLEEWATRSGVNGSLRHARELSLAVVVRLDARLDTGRPVSVHYRALWTASRGRCESAVIGTPSLCGARMKESDRSPIAGRSGPGKTWRMEKRDRRCHCPWEASEQRKSQVLWILGICGFSQYPPNGSTALGHSSQR